LATALQNWAQQYISPTTTSIIFVFEPVVGAICGFWILDEMLTGRQLVGCALIVIAMLWGTIDFSRKKKIKSPNTG